MKGMGRVYFLIALLFVVSISTFAQKAKYQSDIVFRLSQFITWPESNDEYKFVIGVVGTATDFQSFQKLAIQKQGFHNNPIEVRYFACTDAIDDCHLLYVSEDCKIQIESIIKKTQDKPILIISGKKGFGALGSVINFVDTEGKLKFELNQGQADKRGLQVSEKLKNLAIVI